LKLAQVFSQTADHRFSAGASSLHGFQEARSMSSGNGHATASPYKRHLPLYSVDPSLQSTVHHSPFFDLAFTRFSNPEDLRYSFISHNASTASFLSFDGASLLIATGSTSSSNRRNISRRTPSARMLSCLPGNIRDCDTEHLVHAGAEEANIRVCRLTHLPG
jgi:hypothetical protein